MSHEIFLKYFIEYLFFCSTHGFDIELYDVLYSMLCKLYILWIRVLDSHIHCVRVWYEIINCWAQPWLSFGILQALRWSWECIRYFFFIDTGFCSEILKSALFPSFGKMHLFIFFKELFRLLNCLHIFADFVLFLALVDDTPWWKISIE